jgi:hypothetical protein
MGGVFIYITLYLSFLVFDVLCRSWQVIMLCCHAERETGASLANCATS